MCVILANNVFGTTNKKQQLKKIGSIEKKFAREVSSLQCTQTKYPVVFLAIYDTRRTQSCSHMIIATMWPMLNSCIPAHIATVNHDVILVFIRDFETDSITCLSSITNHNHHVWSEHDRQPARFLHSVLTIASFSF